MRSCVLGCQVPFSSDNYINSFLLKETNAAETKFWYKFPDKLPVSISIKKLFSAAFVITLSVFQKEKYWCAPPRFESRGAIVTLRNLDGSRPFFSPQCAILHGVTDPPLNGKVFHGVGRFGGLQGFLNYQLAGQPVYYRVMEGDIR